MRLLKLRSSTSRYQVYALYLLEGSERARLFPSTAGWAQTGRGRLVVPPSESSRTPAVECLRIDSLGSLNVSGDSGSRLRLRERDPRPRLLQGTNLLLVLAALPSSHSLNSYRLTRPSFNGRATSGLSSGLVAQGLTRRLTSAPYAKAPVLLAASNGHPEPAFLDCASTPALLRSSFPPYSAARVIHS